MCPTVPTFFHPVKLFSFLRISPNFKLDKNYFILEWSLYKDRLLSSVSVSLYFCTHINSLTFIGRTVLTSYGHLLVTPPRSTP